MRLIVLVVLVMSAGVARGEVSCFRTPAQAAVGVGEAEGGGYRLELIRRDAVGGGTWARVRSCAHPDWPGVVIRSSSPSEFVPHHPQNDKAVLETRHPDVVPGARVRVIGGDAVVRMEMTGVVQGSARIGERVSVRILAPAGDGEGHMEMAVVRSAEMLEVVREAR